MIKGKPISKHQLFTEGLIPWATARRSIDRIFQSGELRFFTIRGKGAKARPTHYTTLKWLNKYIKKTINKN